MSAASLSDRVALVTGASRGIGRGIARRLARSGAKVFVTARSLHQPVDFEGTLDETVALIEQSGGRAVALGADLENPSERDALVAEACEALKGGQNVALTSAFVDLWPGETESVAAVLGELTQAVLALADVAGLILTGGDIARAVSHSLGATGLRVVGEIQAGVVKGVLVGGSRDGMRVVTKAGGFGDEQAILQSVQGLRGRTR